MTGVRRRTVLHGLGALGLLAALPACSSPWTGTRLRLAAGTTGNNYFRFGTALAAAWGDELAVTTDVRPTTGSGENLQLLAAGGADAVISQVDLASDQLDRTPAGDPRALRALARIYDDTVHVVVRADSPVTTLAGLRDLRVSLGAPSSGVVVIAERLLTAAGLAPRTDVRAQNLGVAQSAAALREGSIDAFFWSGGLPTQDVSALAAAVPIRLLDLGDVIRAVRARWTEYVSGTVPARTYGTADPVTTLLVRNFLLVGADMADDLAYALVEAMFRRQPQLAGALPLALTIDLRRAIGTEPVPLHPGAERYFREAKD